MENKTQAIIDKWTKDWEYETTVLWSEESDALKVVAIKKKFKNGSEDSYEMSRSVKVDGAWVEDFILGFFTEKICLEAAEGWWKNGLLLNLRE